jgi:hypothetical protein
MPCDPPLAYVTYRVTQAMIDSDGSFDSFSYAAFDLLDASVIAEKNQLAVFVNGVEKTVDVDYTVDDVTQLVSFPEGVLEVDDFIKIARDTEKCERYVDFEDNTVLTEKDLNLDSNQIFFVAQEAFDLAYQSLRLNDGGTMWDGRGYEANNFLPATHSSSLVTLGQVQNLVNGVDTATVDGCRIYGFEGDGTEDTFPLDDGVPTSIDACQVLVMVDGVVQEPDCGAGNPPPVEGFSMDPTNNSPGCGAYTVELIDGVPHVVFTSPPANTASVSIRVLTGTVAAVFAEASIDGDRITPGTISTDRWTFEESVSSANRTLIVYQDGSFSIRPPTLDDLDGWDDDVLAFRLDQFAVPTANVSLNTNRITNLSAGTSSTDAANVGQITSAVAAEAVLRAAADADLQSQITAIDSNASNLGRTVVGRVSVTNGTQTDWAVPSTVPNYATAAFDGLHVYFQSETGNIDPANSWFLTGADTNANSEKALFDSGSAVIPRIYVTRQAGSIRFRAHANAAASTVIKFSATFNP